MLKRLTNLLLILAVGVSVSAGIPLHSGGSGSGMIDCCKKALEQDDSPQVAVARLCCAMNCNEPGATTGNTSQGFSQAGLEPSSSIVLPLPPVSNYKPLRAQYGRTSCAYSEPSYLLNLALLI
jgi:hypothetical protein